MISIEQAYQLRIDQIIYEVEKGVILARKIDAIKIYRHEFSIEYINLYGNLYHIDEKNTFVSFEEAKEHLINLAKAEVKRIEKMENK